MTTTVESHASSTSGNESMLSHDELLAHLDALEPNRSQVKTALFAKAYPTILRAIAKNVPQKAILNVLAKGGLKLHPARYRDMLMAEKDSRDELGEHIRCELCHSVLHPDKDDASSAKSSQAVSAPVRDAISKALSDGKKNQANGDFE